MAITNESLGEAIGGYKGMADRKILTKLTGYEDGLSLVNEAKLHLEESRNYFDNDVSDDRNIEIHVTSTY